jgi:hypothetical protein
VTVDDQPSQPLGGVYHTYLGYDAVKFGSAQPSDAGGAARGAFEHLLAMGSMRRFTDEELAEAIRIEPSQIQGLGPSLEALIELLEQRRAKILATYDPAPATNTAARAFLDSASRVVPATGDAELAKRIARAIATQQLRDLERFWYRLEEGSPAQRALTQALERLREKYEVDQLASKWAFTGREPLGVEQAIAVKEELEEIDRLLEQLRQALKNAKPAIIDMDALEQFAPQEQVDSLREAQRRVNELLERLAEEAGLARTPELVMAYAIGGATNAQSAGQPPAYGYTGATLSIEALVRTNDPSLRVFAHASTDLLTAGWSTNNVTATDLAKKPDDPADTARRVFSVPQGTDPAKFLRLRIELDP